MTPTSKQAAPSEDQLQVECANYLRLALGEHWIFHHSPNGGLRNVREAAKLSRMGVLPGFPDFVFLGPRNHQTRGVLFAELKSRRGALRAEQKEFARWAENNGYPWTLARSLEDLVAFLHVNGVPLRAKLQGRGS